MRGWFPWVLVGLFFLGASNLLLVVALVLVGSQLATLGRTWSERSRFLARERAQLANPADFDARHRLGEIYLRGGQLRKAEITRPQTLVRTSRARVYYVTTCVTS